MELHRRFFSTDGSLFGNAASPAGVSPGLRAEPGGRLEPGSWIDPGVWAVENGCTPPATHDPARLLGGFAAVTGMAVSLRTDTMLACQAGTALAEKLDRCGFALGCLAGLALHEIIINAAIHGNLQVASRPAVGWRERQAFISRIEAELANPGRAARAVTVALGWHEAKLCAAIVDEGVGYDVRSSAPAPPGGKLEAAGRGIAIARAAACVEVLDGGTCTRLIFDRACAPGTAE